MTAASRPEEFGFDLANEFASVLVRRIHTGNGVRLRITSPRTDHSIDLDPLELESLTWQSHEFFSALLRTPHGPEGGPEHGGGDDG